MNYKEKIRELMVPRETLVEAEQIFIQYSVSYFRHYEKPTQPVHEGQLIENEAVLTEVRDFQLAGKIFLETLPDDMEPMENLDKFVEQMDRCKSTLSACMNATRGRIAKMR